MGTSFKSGKDKAGKGEELAPISYAVYKIKKASSPHCPRALDNREYLMIIFLIFHQNHML